MLKDAVEEIPEQVKKIIKKYWPGPLTILFKKSKKSVIFQTQQKTKLCF